ncbi:MAG: hypothetical protein Q8O67_06920 [Deltaproteobacteria bacterium]|nr:hypothetical protein [Deltaproteobacteria bacterium]
MRPLHRAYSLIVVLLTLGLITVALFCLLAFLEVGVKTSADNIERRKMFYVCDGMTRIVAEVLKDFMRTATLAPGESGANALKGYLERADVGGGPALPKLVPEGFVLSDYDIDDFSHVGDAVPIPSGAFSGLVGKEDKLRILVDAESADGRFTCSVKQEISLTQVGLFQMALWSAIPRTRLYFSTSGTDALLGINGRVHAQGDLLIAEGPNNAGVAFASQVTAAGRISGTGACAEALGTMNPFLVADVDLDTPAAPATGLDASSDTRLKDPLPQACVDSDWLGATGSSSVNGRASDARLGVQPLSLPLPVPASEVEDPLRFLIDPVTNDAALDDRERHKFAYKADIRIIDGVWYLANALNRGDWPGMPIWSDHPGHKVETFVVGGVTKTIAVGQTDLRVARGWGLATPTHYSPYGYNVGTHAVNGSGFGAITYGTIASNFDGGAVIANGIFGLAFFPDPTSIGCTRTTPSPLVPLPRNTYRYVGGTSTCGSPWTTTSTALHAARWGFQDHQLTVDRSDATPYLDPVQVAGSRGNISPINFSVLRFAAALQSTTTGQLGSYFPAGGRKFNGVVWISSRWPGAWTSPEPLLTNEPRPAVRPPVPVHHYFGTTPSTYPGGSGPTDDVPSESYPPLPYPMCSDDLGGTPYDDPAYEVHACDAPWYQVTRDAAGAHAAYPNALRVFRAATVFNSGSATFSKLPNGLTIATNLPVYVAGDVNVSSPAARTSADVGGAQWAPFAVAGDNVALLSGQFQDDNFPWWNIAASRPGPSATATFNMEILTGVSRGTGPCDDASKLCGDSLLSGVRVLEDWGPGGPKVISHNGSIVVGYHSRYVDPAFALADQEIDIGSGQHLSSWPSAFRIGFDHNLNRLSKQPPGTEALSIQSIRQWERD